jgi:hypothetical protein
MNDAAPPAAESSARDRLVSRPANPLPAAPDTAAAHPADPRPVPPGGQGTDPHAGDVGHTA